MQEVIALQDMGHKRLAIEAGEDPVNNPIEYILECHRDHLLHQAQKRRHPPGQREHRRHHRGELPQAQGRRHRHLHPLPGDLSQADLRDTCTPPAPSTTTPTTPRPWTGPWRAASTTWAWACCSAWRGTSMSSPACSCTPSIWKQSTGVGPHTISVPRVKKADDIDPDRLRQRPQRRDV